MLMYLLTRVLTLLTLVWVLRFVWRLLTDRKEPDRAAPRSKPKPVAGELKQDPHCGTYVSTEISLKSRIGDQELHFCSRKCQEEFLRARSTVPH